MAAKPFILISDGIDYGSKVTLPTSIEFLQRADVLVYSILFADYANGYNPGMHAQQQLAIRAAGTKVMGRLAQETGGDYFEVSKKESIDQIYRELEDELRNQYSIGYTPDLSRDSNRYRKIKLIINRKGLFVRTRDGYYP